MPFHYYRYIFTDKLHEFAGREIRRRGKLSVGTTLTRCRPGARLVFRYRAPKTIGAGRLRLRRVPLD
ncbi:MAG: hypothetical protein R3C10_01000 [Pirellulales bacterium]|nr:hypothetical protein [Planctomycetales bacterium]